MEQLTQVGLTNQEIEYIGRMRYKKSNLRSLSFMLYSCTVLIILVGALLIAFYPDWIPVTFTAFPPFFVLTWIYDKKERMAGLEFLKQITNQ